MRMPKFVLHGIYLNDCIKLSLMYIFEMSLETGNGLSYVPGVAMSAM